MLLNIRILVFSLQTSEFLPYPYNHCDSGLILSNIRILTFSFQTFEFWHELWTILNIGILP